MEHAIEETIPITNRELDVVKMNPYILAVNHYLWELNAVRRSVTTLFSDAIRYTSYAMVLYMCNGLQVGLSLRSD
jgi:hypothetical protein